MIKHATKNSISLEEAAAEGIDEITFKRRWLILATLCGSLLVAMLSNSAMNLALPSIAVNLNATSSELNWIVESYSLMFAGLLFTAGAVGDRYGRKLLMQIGLIVFLSASLYAAFIASSSFELILMRALMGVGGAMVMPTTLSILNVSFHSKERTKAVAIWGAVAGGGVLVGSIVSGFLLEHFQWESVFILCAVVAAVVLVTNHILTHESKDEQHTKVDWLGGVLSTIGLGTLVYGLMESSHEAGWSSWDVWVPIIISAVFLTGFVFWQLHTEHPMLDVRLFKSRKFTISVLTITLAFFAINGVMFIMSQLFQLVLNYSPMEASLRMLPIVAPLFGFAPLAPKMVGWVGEKWTLFIGILFLTAGFTFSAFWNQSQPSYGEVWLGMVLILGGMLFTSTPATNLMLDSVPKNRSGMGSAMNDTTRELGGALGVAILGSVMVSKYNALVADKLDGLSGLPDAIVPGLKESLAVALQTIKAVEPQGLDLSELGNSLKQMWMEGLSSAMSIAAVLCGITALLVLFFMGKHERETTDTVK